MVEFTTKFGLFKPDFNVSGWHGQVNGNFDSIDALLFSVIGLGNFVGEWTNSTNYTEQQRVFDPDDGTIWNCLVDHTSSATDSFSDDRADNPGNWSSVSSIPIARGAWQNDTLYGAGDISYDAGESLIGIASTTHTSLSAPNTMRDDAANWTFIADLSAVAVLVNSVNGQTGVVVLESDHISDVGETHKFVTAAEKAQITTNQGNIATALASIATHTSDIAANASDINNLESDLAALTTEGSWSPTLEFGGDDTGITYITRVGRYIKVGNLVTVWGKISLSSNGSETGEVTITGLPFAASVVSGLEYSGSIGRAGNIVGAGNGLAIVIESGSNEAILYICEEDGGDDYEVASQEGTLLFNNDANLSFTITYRTG